MDLGYMRIESDSSNNSDADRDFIETNPRISIPYLTFLCLFTLTGSIGNLMVIGSVVTYKHCFILIPIPYLPVMKSEKRMQWPLRTVGNLIIVNLAVADFAVTGFVNPFSIVGVIKGEVWFEHRRILCTVVATICSVTCLASLSNIMVISINRYVHICHSQKYITIYTLKNTIGMCIVVWIMCIIIEIPNHFGLSDHIFDNKNLACVWDRLHTVPYFHVMLGGFVAISSIITMICYYFIFAHVRKSKNKIHQSKLESATNIKDRNDSLKLAKTLCVIFVTFISCWTPYTVISMADRQDALPLSVHLYFLLLAHINSSVNSIIYGLTNKQFRIAYMKLVPFGKCLCNNKSAVGPQSTTEIDLSQVK